jgi:hypothetical protein
MVSAMNSVKVGIVSFFIGLTLAIMAYEGILQAIIALSHAMA